MNRYHQILHRIVEKGKTQKNKKGERATFTLNV